MTEPYIERTFIALYAAAWTAEHLFGGRVHCKPFAFIILRNTFLTGLLTTHLSAIAMVTQDRVPLLTCSCYRNWALHKDNCLSIQVVVVKTSLLWSRGVPFPPHWWYIKQTPWAFWDAFLPDSCVNRRPSITGDKLSAFVNGHSASGRCFISMPWDWRRKKSPYSLFDL